MSKPSPRSRDSVNVFFFERRDLPGCIAVLAVPHINAEDNCMEVGPRSAEGWRYITVLKRVVAAQPAAAIDRDGLQLHSEAGTGVGFKSVEDSLYRWVS